MVDITVQGDRVVFEVEGLDLMHPDAGEVGLAFGGARRGGGEVRFAVGCATVAKGNYV